MSINCVVLLHLYNINCHNIDMCRSLLCTGFFDNAINCGTVRPYNYYVLQEAAINFVNVVSN